MTSRYHDILDGDGNYSWILFRNTIRYAVLAISIIFFALIRYINTFMLKQRSREFAVYMGQKNKALHPQYQSTIQLHQEKTGKSISLSFVPHLLFALIRYINTFMLKQRSREFAVYMVLGMEQKMVARQFFLETLIFGIFFNRPLDIITKQLSIHPCTLLPIWLIHPGSWQKIPFGKSPLY